MSLQQRSGSPWKVEDWHRGSRPSCGRSLRAARSGADAQPPGCRKLHPLDPIDRRGPLIGSFG